MAHWVNNTLVHNWYGSSHADEVGYLLLNTDKRKPQPFVFVADTFDDSFVRFYYEKPDADELFEAFSRWQMRC